MGYSIHVPNDILIPLSEIMFKAIIFDYGGTLDTRGNHWGRVIFHAYERHLPEIEWEAFREAYIYGERTLGKNPIVKPTFTFKETLDVKLRLQMEHLTLHNHWKPTAEEFKHIHMLLLNDLYDGVRETVAESKTVLEYLHSKNIPMVLVSNFYGNVNVVLQEMRLSQYFYDVVESAIVGVRKPDPEIFRLGIESLRKMQSELQPKDILVVGDSLTKDIIPAASLGCLTALYEGEQWENDDVVSKPLPVDCHRIQSLNDIFVMLEKS